MAKGVKDQGKKERLAQALRDNLRKRKAQSRQRSGQSGKPNGREDIAAKSGPKDHLR